MPTALITGASSGIGVAFAEVFAAEGYDLFLVARNKERLDAVAQDLKIRFDVNTRVVVADLVTDEGIAIVEDLLASSNPAIDFLVNNAGFGHKGVFHETSVEEHVDVLRVNALAVLRLTHAAMKAMLPRKEGNIINVASVAAFTPGVRPSSTYAASKAFVAALTEGLAPSALGTGVHLSAVCPGWTRSEFHSRAGIGMSKLPGFMWLSPTEVAECAVRDHRAGKVLTVPGVVYKIILGMSRAAPRPLVRTFSRIAGRLSH